ncbi:helix-turn-helix domain-containing protein [Heliobacterium mobile]|nr:helix-turn-helix domain-containing protein [Heliobacterium mobile]
MTGKMISIAMERSFDVIDKKWDNDIYVKMYRSAVTSGLIAKLGPERWTVLCIIASYMDEQGNCFPSQSAIAKGFGCTRQTALRWINSLLAFRWNNRPVIERVKNRRRNGLSYYTILPLSQLAIFNGEVEPTGDVQSHDFKELDVKDLDVTMSKSTTSDVKEPDVTMSKVFDTNYNHYNKNHSNKNHSNQIAKAGTVGNTDIDPTDLTHPKKIIEYFCEKYRQRYTVNYNPNWKRDVGLVKNKLMTVYEPVQIRSIIDTVFAEYDTRWKKDTYPRPSIGQLATWLSNEALAVAEEEQRTDFTQVKRHGGYSVEAIMARLERGSGKE